MATALDVWRGAVAHTTWPPASLAGGAAGARADLGLAWQTTVGQIVFLQSVVYERT